MDDKLKQLLRELGTAINESISSSEDVNRYIQRIRDEGYNLYVVLDATIGLGRNDEDESGDVFTGTERVAIPKGAENVQFRINVNDLGFLRSVGIDPTRKVRSAKRAEGKLTDAGSTN